jgi:hypothetical protein
MGGGASGTTARGRAMTRSQLSTGVLTALLLTAATALAGCSSSHLIADNLPAAAGGLPEDVPARPETPPLFPAVHSQPPTRANATLTEAERKRLKEELTAARNRATGHRPPAEATKTSENIKKRKKSKKKTQIADPVTTGSTSAAGSAANP